MFWDYEIEHSSTKTTATKTLTLYSNVLFISKTSERVSSGSRTRKTFWKHKLPEPVQMKGASWLAKNYNGSNSSVVAIG